MKKLILILLLFCVSAGYAQNSKTELSAKEIVDKAENSIKGESSQGTFKMIINNPDFRREMVMESWWEGEKALIEINEPAKDRGNKTLKIGNEIWNYLKNTESRIKIPPSMMLQSWKGSDLTYDDMVRESELVNDYNIKLMFEEKIAGEMCWKLELTPKEKAAVVWGKIYYWVRQDDYLPALVQYYDEDGKLVRTMKFSEYKTMDGRKIPSIWKIIDNQNEGEWTKFIYLDVNFDVDIPDSKFSFRELER